jgi:hypothetical protein
MNKIYNLHSDQNLTINTELIPWLNYLIGSNLIKESTH